MTAMFKDSVRISKNHLSMAVRSCSTLKRIRRKTSLINALMALVEYDTPMIVKDKLYFVEAIKERCLDIKCRIMGTDIQISENSDDIPQDSIMIASVNMITDVIDKCLENIDDVDVFRDGTDTHYIFEIFYGENHKCVGGTVQTRSWVTVTMPNDSHKIGSLIFRRSMPLKILYRYNKIDSEFSEAVMCTMRSQSGDVAKLDFERSVNFYADR